MSLVSYHESGELIGVAVWGDEPTNLLPDDVLPPVGTCKTVEGVSDLVFVTLFGTGPLLDAGASIPVETTDGVLTLSRVDSELLGWGWYLLQDTSFNVTPGSVFTLRAPGGPDVSPFVGAMTAPSAISVTTPLGAIEPDRSYPIAWTSTGGFDIVHVLVEGDAAVACSFEDTGSALIPPSALEKADLDGRVTARVVIGKGSVGAFTASEAGLALTQFWVQRQWIVDVEPD